MSRCDVAQALSSLSTSIWRIESSWLARVSSPSSPVLDFEYTWLTGTGQYSLADMVVFPWCVCPAYRTSSYNDRTGSSKLAYLRIAQLTHPRTAPLYAISLRPSSSTSDKPFSPIRIVYVSDPLSKLRFNIPGPPPHPSLNSLSRSIRWLRRSRSMRRARFQIGSDGWRRTR